MENPSLTQQKPIENILTDKLEDKVKSSENYNLFLSGLLAGLVLNLLATIVDRLMHDNLPQYYNYYAVLVIVMSYFILLWIGGIVAENFGYRHTMQKYIKILKKNS